MSIAYQAYLQSEDWRQKRLRVIAIYKGICVRCGRKKAEAQLQIHHEEYGQNLKDVPIKKLKPLCFTCHEIVSQSSPEELFERA